MHGDVRDRCVKYKLWLYIDYLYWLVYCFHLQNATFQLLLASDGLTTYTSFLFKSMNFLPPKRALMGYRCGRSSSSIFNHPGSLSSTLYSQVFHSGDNGKIFLHLLELRICCVTLCNLTDNQWPSGSYVLHMDLIRVWSLAQQIITLLV